MGAGTQQFPYVSSGASLVMASEGGNVDAAAGVITSETSDPVEGRIRYLFGLSTLKRYAEGQVENAFRRDARAALVEGIDELIIKGNSSPNIDGLEDALTTPGNASDTVTALNILNAYSGRVDGKYAYKWRDVRMAVRQEVYQKAIWLQVAANADRFLSDILDEDVNFRATGHITAPSSGRSNGISYAPMNDRPDWFTPIWEDAMVITDPYTHSASGQMAITFNVALNNIILDNSPWKQHNFKHT